VTDKIKVFLVDASALEGLLRILSFLFLGVPLIGIGMLYTKVLNAEAKPGQGARPGGGTDAGKSEDKVTPA